MGRTLAYRSYLCRIETATLFGDPAPPGVVVGPLKMASASSIVFHVASGISVLPPFACHHSAPPSQAMKSTSAPAARMTFMADAVSSGPTPSPFRTATFLDMLLLTPFYRPETGDVVLFEIEDRGPLAALQ